MSTDQVCAICSRPARISDGIIGAQLCESTACMHEAWSRAYAEGDEE